MRQLKHHEKKLLKKVDFLRWKTDDNVRETQVMRTYHIQNRDDYKKYNKVVGMITKLTSLLKQLDPKDTARIELTDNLLEKLYSMGVLATKKSLGHVRVGPSTVTDPAHHITRSMEDFVTWVDTSKIKRKVLKYNDALDDYDLL
ncbi:MAG: hypothetical protein WDW38_001435 [Sanguina aurantia]